MGRAAVSSSQQHLPPTKCFFTLISNSKMYKAHLAFHFITVNIQQERKIVKWISNEFREDPGIILRNRETFSFSILPSLYKVESIILEWLQSMYIELIKYLNNRRYDLIILYNWKILHSVEFSRGERSLSIKPYITQVRHAFVARVTYIGGGIKIVFPDSHMPNTRDPGCPSGVTTTQKIETFVETPGRPPSSKFHHVTRAQSLTEADRPGT